MALQLAIAQYGISKGDGMKLCNYLGFVGDNVQLGISFCKERPILLGIFRGSTQTSTSAISAFSSMNLRRGGTSSPISMSNVMTAPAAPSSP